MNCNELFAQLVQRFRSYDDAAVLWILLKEHADLREYSDSTYQLASIQLCDTVNRKTVSRTIQRLQEMGFIEAWIVKNAKTRVKVNRDAVLDFLRQPIPARLPACSDKTFPFLEAWNADLQAQAVMAAQSSDDALSS
jgi:hypothetical protein